MQRKTNRAIYRHFRPDQGCGYAKGWIKCLSEKVIILKESCDSAKVHWRSELSEAALGWTTSIASVSASSRPSVTGAKRGRNLPWLHAYTRDACPNQRRYGDFQERITLNIEQSMKFSWPLILLFYFMEDYLNDRDYCHNSLVQTVDDALKALFLSTWYLFRSFFNDTGKYLLNGVV